MSRDVVIYTEPPEPLLRLLGAHVPHSLPLLRRLRFTRFPGGITEHARILYAASAELTTDATPEDAPFAAGYLDFSRGPETELWLYSSLERGRRRVSQSLSLSPLGPTTTTTTTITSGGGTEEGRSAASSREEEEEEDQVFADQCTTHALALLREVRRQRDLYAAADHLHAQEQHATALLGTLSETLRQALLGRGVVFPYTEPYDKWMFRVDELPDVVVVVAAALAKEGVEGMRWDALRREDIPLALSRTHINRKERTVRLLPSKAIYLNDGTPIAWSFLGPDSSLSSLHCEEGYRGRGFAKAVAVKLLRDRLKDYGDEGYAWADVARDNPSSQGVCKSLGGKVAWTVSW